MERQEINFLFNYLVNNQKHLNSLQNEFITSLKNHYNSTGVLTQRQVECLFAIKEYVPSLVMEEVFYESESDKYQAQYSSFDSSIPFNI